jgi:hypothetical protein
VGGKRFSRKAQVALYVLGGIIVLFLIVLSIYLGRLKKTETLVTTGQDQQLLNNPELAAERARMQQRLDECLGQTTLEVLEDYQNSGISVSTIEQAEPRLAEEISMRFPDCLFRFNTIDKLQAGSDDAPRVSVTLGTEGASVSAEYSVVGTYNDKNYPLASFQTNVPSDLGHVIATAGTVRKALLSPEARTAPSSDNPTLAELARTLFDDECRFNLYALEDQGWYADLVTLDDGKMNLYLYNYNDYLDGKTSEEPTPIPVDLPPCVPKTSPTV